MMSDNKLNFEQAYAALEQITERLNSTDVPLEEAVKLYEEGIKLAAFCETELKKAKQKIETLRSGN